MHTRTPEDGVPNDRKLRITDAAIDLALGNLIRTARHAAGLTQNALARELGITYQQLQKYEKGTNRVAISRLIAIARVLGVTPASLLPEIDE